MELASLAIEKIHILRVDPGEDVLLSVKRFLAETGLQQALVLGGYGTLAAHHLHSISNLQFANLPIPQSGESWQSRSISDFT